MEQQINLQQEQQINLQQDQQINLQQDQQINLQRDLRINLQKDQPFTNIRRNNAIVNITDSGNGAVLGEYVVRRDGVHRLAENVVEGIVFEVTYLQECEVVGILGRTNGCVVKLRQHRESQRLYASKEMEFGSEREALLQMRELKINRDMSPHERVVTFYQAFYSNNILTFLLEYMDGGSLTDIIARNRRNGRMIGEEYLSEIARQVLQGLQWFHVARVVHRDIKPSNILMNRSGQVKIADFGISKPLFRSSDYCITGVGTPAYMSPERIDGHVPYNDSCDIWSLGLTLLECTTGRNPYIPSNGASLPSLFDLQCAIVKGPTPEAGDGFSQAFQKFVSMCVQKDPNDRASIPDLLNHEFIARYRGREANMSDLLV